MANGVMQKAIAVGKKAFPGLSYIPGDSFIYRIHPLAKVTALVVFSIAIFSFSELAVNAIMLGCVLLLYGVSGLGFRFFFQKLRFIFIFAFFIMLVQVLLGVGGRLLVDWQFWFLHIRIWSEGLRMGALIMLRFVNIIASSYLFVATSNPHQLVYGLMQVGLPYRYGFMLVTALRFIPVFQQEITLIRNAQMAKGIDMEGVSLKRMIQAVRFLLVPLVISALNKVDSLVISMEGRAFGASAERSYLVQQSFGPTDWLVLALCPCFFAGMLLLNRAVM